MSANAELVAVVKSLRDEVRKLRQALERPERIAYTPREFAAACGIPYESVLALIANGELDAVKRDGYRGYLISTAAGARFLDPHQRPRAA